MNQIFPTLITERLTLAPLTEADAESMFEWASDPEVTRYVTWRAHSTPADSLLYIHQCLARTTLVVGQVFVAWAIRDRAGRAMGSISFTQVGEIQGQIGFVLRRDQWDHGYTREACEAVIDWAFDRLVDIERIQGRCLPHNMGSCRVFEKIGMNFEGVNCAMVRVQNKPADVACYAIVRRLWAIRKQEGISGKSLESEMPGSFV
ncbi:MAG: GNAT family N-acetyltransferase [Bdellovibrionales bacterium]|nr:GNAT family N-acetyltransferase [Bdellovibrionales bacterium]